MTEQEGNYIYCIIATNEEQNFPIKGIGNRGDRVYSVCYEDIGAVISDSPIIKYPVNRENTIAHQVAMEELMKEYTILPVRFCTIAEGKDGTSPRDRIKEKILKERHEEFKVLLAEMKNKVELGVKALWTDMELIFQEITEVNKEIRILRNRLLSMKKGTEEHNERIRLGGLVKFVLERKKEKEANRILKPLKEISADSRINNTFGDRMILNAAFLVDKDRTDKFDSRMNQLDEDNNGRIHFKYVGPVPCCNFLEIVVKW